ncbi:hypothetical protein KC19_VG147000 [Ceratodon purpureus]|uniref:Uncharacterized protein n=1 Tax=Ceratodon purpureus TaxID=3225 RepID=A0A8T0HQL8_CERPU|nr:hypothetical protein KC19_VG147000 [Ceratodon purpureus]
MVLRFRNPTATHLFTSGDPFKSVSSRTRVDSSFSLQFNRSENIGCSLIISRRRSMILFCLLISKSMSYYPIPVLESLQYRTFPCLASRVLCVSLVRRFRSVVTILHALTRPQ